MKSFFVTKKHIPKARPSKSLPRPQTHAGPATCHFPPSAALSVSSDCLPALLLLQRRVDKWGHEEVLRWLANVGLLHYADRLKERSIAGRVQKSSFCCANACARVPDVASTGSPKAQAGSAGHMGWLSVAGAVKALHPGAQQLVVMSCAQELLALSQMDVYELAASQEDAERWVSALAALHAREVRSAACALSPSTC